MNRKAIRDLASKELGLKQPTIYATTATNCERSRSVGMPCVVKPLMSSSEKDVHYQDRRRY
jgi:phosphoribosylglycinamide formyltransferase 2